MLANSFRQLSRATAGRALVNQSTTSFANLAPFATAASQPSDPKTVLAILYKAGDAAKEKRLLGCVENELGLREWLESQGHKFIVTDSKEGADSDLDKYLPEADVVITTPFHPGYLSQERLSKANKLKLALTAGIGSDHVDLDAAAKNGVTVAEITGSNVVSVAEHVVMMILTLVRNYMPAHKQIIKGDWNVAEIAKDAFDLEDKVVGTVGAGRIGQRVLQRLAGFDCKELLYTDYKQLPASLEKSLNCRYVADVGDLVSQCDVVTINCPLHKGTEHLFNKDMISKFKKGSYLVNTARGKIAETQAVVDALESGQLRGYAGDVWYPQPAPKDHPWRTMPNHAMTPHYSGTTLDAQMRYAAGTKDVLDRFFNNKPLKKDDVIVEGGKMAAQYDAAAKDRNMQFESGWEKVKTAAKNVTGGNKGVA
ncbi:formate dehydrogenase (NAD+) [Trebouxia sp. C0009 RCD-2024]